MPISLNDSRATPTPVVKRTAIGETFTGAIVRFAWRDVLKDGQPQINEKGKRKQELVVTCVTMPGTTSPVGLGEYQAVPAPGDVVRVILRGKAASQWIDATRAHGDLSVGDVLTQVTTNAQQYDANGKPKGKEITKQAELEAVPRGTSVGVYGDLTIAKPADVRWVDAAEAAYHDSEPERPRIAIVNDDLEEPF